LLKLIGKSEKTATTFDLVCDIVGGKDKAGDRLGANQTGVTFRAVHHVFVPETYLLEQARTLGLFKIAATPAASGSSSGTNSSVLTLSMACGVDLDGGEWKCSDKANAQSRLDKIMGLTRLWTREQMHKYAHNTKLDYAKL
jgi:hypothetical protein